MLSMSRLLREAIARAVTWDNIELDTAQSQLAGVILNEIGTLPQVKLGLPMPYDLRLMQIARALLDRPDDDRNLEAWARWAGIAPRTLTRRFSSETGFSFTEWRQRVRLLKALELLAEGKTVSAVALDMGYQNVSAFIALFRRSFAITPGQYVALVTGGPPQRD